MKSKALVFVLFIIVILSLLLNIRGFSKLKEANAEVVTLETRNEKLSQEKDKIEKKLSDLAVTNKLAEENLKETENQLKVSEDILNSINEKLVGDKTIIEKIDDIVNKNNQLKKENDTMASRLTDLEKQIDSLEKEEDVAETTNILNNAYEKEKQWVKDLDDLDEYLENRIGDLKSASDTLPALSLERIMINQEIDFLEEAKDQVIQIKSDINNLVNN